MTGLSLSIYSDMICSWGARGYPHAIHQNLGREPDMASRYSSWRDSRRENPELMDLPVISEPSGLSRGAAVFQKKKK
jgi:hypothetical protein